MKIRRNKLAFGSGAVIVGLILAALLAPLITSLSPTAVNLDRVKLPPGPGHIFGTDEKGRDIFSRVVYGARISLKIGLLATTLALLTGTIIGLLGGYFGGLFDGFFQMVTDITLAFPGLLLAIGIAVVLTPGWVTVLIALTLVGWASLARLVRGEVLSLKKREFVEAARAGGASPLRIIFKHILPNCLPLLLVAGSLKVGSFILGEAALSFLDLGVRPPAPSWGLMISASREYLRAAPWMAIFPGVALALTVFAFNLLGDALRDRFDPKLKE